MKISKLLFLLFVLLGCISSCTPDEDSYYECNNGCYESEYGSFTSYEACANNCSSNNNNNNNNNNTTGTNDDYTYTLIDNGNCRRRTDGSGEYATEAECEAAASEMARVYFWDNLDLPNNGYGSPTINGGNVIYKGGSPVSTDYQSCEPPYDIVLSPGSYTYVIYNLCQVSCTWEGSFTISKGECKIIQLGNYR